MLNFLMVLLQAAVHFLSCNNVPTFAEYSHKNKQDEEADTRIALHLHDQGATNILVSTVDTVILVGLFFNIQSPVNVWVRFDTGEKFSITALTVSVKHWGKTSLGPYLSCLLWVRHHIAQGKEEA